ncbi:MAG: PDC sensor domain-containing protein [Gammaproteobacteria bacterium]|nr:PDC sensor domain-containing protein [Gammaproteobacteria bacterium]
MITSAQQSIVRQRDALAVFLKAPLSGLASACARVWDDIAAVENVLREGLQALPYCDHLIAMSLDGIQISSEVSALGIDRGCVGSDRSLQPYMKSAVPMADYVLSESYISQHSKRPSITAVQIVKREDKPMGFISAHFHLHDLPLTAPLYEESKDWLQMKGDPSIRGALFYQQRFPSVLDQHVDTVIAVIEELVLDHGICHCDIYSSSNRATVWTQADSYRYRVLTIEELVDPNVCLTFPKSPYPDTAVIAQLQVRSILECFRDLRFTDENIYLRIGSLNIYNGMVGLTFSCDGSHSISADEFLHTGLSFWIGFAAAGTSTVPGLPPPS